MSSDSVNSFTRFLECPICLEEYKDQHIFQCPGGHIFCSNCIGNFKKCPICTVQMPAKPLRNRAMEYVSSHSATLLGYNKDGVKSGAGQATNEKLKTSASAPLTKSTEEPYCKKRKAPEYTHTATCDGPLCARSLVQVIHGIRYKCLQCEDFDLCQRCIDDGVHSHHIFMRITNEEQGKAAEKFCPTPSKSKSNSSYRWSKSSTAYSNN